MIPPLVLIHSPLLFAGVWEPVAAQLRPERGVLVPSLAAALEGPGPYWQSQAALIAAQAAELKGPLVLVGHSGAGPLLALFGRVLTNPIAAYVFVDGGLPAGGSWLSTAPAELAEQLTSQATDGWLPPWSDWWDESDLAAELPDDDQRNELRAGLRPIPLAMFEEDRPPVPDWPDAPCGFLRLSSGYDLEAGQAAAVGWPVESMDSGHLAILTSPVEVADRIRALLSKLEVS